MWALDSLPKKEYLPKFYKDKLIYKYIGNIEYFKEKNIGPALHCIIGKECLPNEADHQKGTCQTRRFASMHVQLLLMHVGSENF